MATVNTSARNCAHGVSMRKPCTWCELIQALRDEAVRNHITLKVAREALALHKK